MGKLLTCAHCGNRGRAGLRAVGEAEAFDIRGVLRGRPVRKCNECQAGVTVGAFGRTKPIEAALWREMTASWEREFGPEVSQRPKRVSDVEPAPKPTSRPARSLREWSAAEKEEFQGELTAALDDLLDEVLADERVGFAEWDDVTRNFFVQFSRLLLGEAVLAHEDYKDCGATPDEMPFILLLVGLRPALEKSGQAASKLGPDNGVSKLLVSLALPFQASVDERVRPELFAAVQKRIYPEL